MTFEKSLRQSEVLSRMLCTIENKKQGREKRQKEILLYMGFDCTMDRKYEAYPPKNWKDQTYSKQL